LHAPSIISIIPLAHPLHPSTTSTHHIHHIRGRYEEAHQKGSTANGTARWHAKENYNWAVQEMEKKMDILVQWTVDDEKYKNTAAVVASRHYCTALNRLEELVIKRLFKLTKMNMSGMGTWWLMVFASC
jgi:hypothetical protein